MIIRRLEEVCGTDREVDTGPWSSRRLLLRHEGMGFSLHDTVVRTGAELPMCYRNHLEAVYCIAGEGELLVVATGERIRIAAGTVYALDQHDEHVLTAFSEMQMVCVFNPPLSGREVHDADGAYPLIAEEDAAGAGEP